MRRDIGRQIIKYYAKTGEPFTIDQINTEVMTKSGTSKVLINMTVRQLIFTLVTEAAVLYDESNGKYRFSETKIDCSHNWVWKWKK